MIIYKKINEYLDNKEKNQYHQMIDYTRLADNLDNDKIKEICKEAETNGFYSICIQPQFVAMTYSFVANEIKIVALIDFPKGDSETKKKINEIDQTIVNGAEEIDVVINYNLIKDPDEHETLEREIREIGSKVHGICSLQKC